MTRKKIEKKENVCPYDSAECKKANVASVHYSSGAVVHVCENRNNCNRYEKYIEESQKMWRTVNYNLRKTGYRCPYNTDIDCGLFERCDEYMRQKSTWIDEKFDCCEGYCMADPNMCQKFLEFNNKQKQR